jgi:hypothetical protein
MSAPVLAGRRLRFHPWAAEDFPPPADRHGDREVQRCLQTGRRIPKRAGMVFTGLQALNGVPNAFHRHDRTA